MDVIFSVIPVNTLLKFSVLVNNIYMGGTVSHILILGPSFYFMTKNGKLVDTLRRGGRGGWLPNGKMTVCDTPRPPFKTG